MTRTTGKTELDFFWGYLWMVQKEKFHLMSQAIKDAVSRGIHVEITVDSEPGTFLAWDLWEQLGFTKGSSGLTHVSIDAVGKSTVWSEGKGLTIRYSSIVPPSRL